MEMEWRSISDLIWINISEFYSCYLANCAYGIITLQIGNLLPHSSSVTTLTLYEFVPNFYAGVAGRLVVLMGNRKLRALWGDLDLKGKKDNIWFQKAEVQIAETPMLLFPAEWTNKQLSTSTSSSNSPVLPELSEDTAVRPQNLCEAKAAGDVAEDVLQFWHHGSTSMCCICIFPLTHMNTKNFADAGRFWTGWNRCI